MCSYYLINNAWPEFASNFFHAQKMYTSDISILRELAFIGDFLLSYAPFVLSFILFQTLFLKRGKEHFNLAIFSLCWVIIAWVPIIMQGKHFTHYYIQALLPLSFIAADIFFIRNADLPKINLWRKAIIVLVAILIITSITEQIRISKSNHKITEVTNYLKARIKPGDNIFAGDSRIYYELNCIPASKYYHPSILFSKDHIQASQINIDQEYVRIFKTKPVYVVLTKEQINKSIEYYLLNKYTLIITIQKYLVYSRVD